MCVESHLRLLFHAFFISMLFFIRGIIKISGCARIFILAVAVSSS